MQHVYVVVTKEGQFCSVCSSKENAEKTIDILNEVESVNPREHWEIVGYNVDGKLANYS